LGAHAQQVLDETGTDVTVVLQGNPALVVLDCEVVMTDTIAVAATAQYHREAWAKQGGQAFPHQIEQGEGYFIFAQ
jgi:hypothetical protein